MSLSRSRLLYSLPVSLLIASGLSVLPGCPLLDVNADAQEVCLTYPNLKIPAAPSGQTTAQQSFTFDDLSKVHDLTKLDANLEFVRAEIHATSGITDFSFIQSAELQVSSPDTSLPTLTMYSCDGDCDPEGSSLVVDAASDATNAVDYLKSDSITVNVAFKGQLPTVDWTMDVDVCMKASASYSLSP